MATKRKKSTSKETDSAYFLKIVMYLIIGAQWLRIEKVDTWQIPIPIGLVLGVLFATHDHFKTDRRIEFAVLLVVSFISFWLPIGISVLL